MACVRSLNPEGTVSTINTDRLLYNLNIEIPRVMATLIFANACNSNFSKFPSSTHTWFGFGSFFTLFVNNCTTKHWPSSFDAL